MENGKKHFETGDRGRKQCSHQNACKTDEHIILKAKTRHCAGLVDSITGMFEANINADGPVCQGIDMIRQPINIAF